MVSENRVTCDLRELPCEKTCINRIRHNGANKGFGSIVPYKVFKVDSIAPMIKTYCRETIACCLNITHKDPAMRKSEKAEVPKLMYSKDFVGVKYPL